MAYYEYDQADDTYSIICDEDGCDGGIVGFVMYEADAIQVAEDHEAWHLYG